MMKEHEVRNCVDITIAALIEFFEDQVRKLANAGVPAEYASDALKVVALRAESLYGSESSRKLAAAAERLRTPQAKTRS